MKKIPFLTLEKAKELLIYYAALPVHTQFWLLYRKPDCIIFFFCNSLNF